MAKMGRPKLNIDWKLFDGFCQMQCTLREIAAYFNCSEDTIERRVKKEYGQTFAEYFSKKRIGGLITLRRNMFKMSETNPAVAIFLAKNWLGMKDKQEISSEDGKLLGGGVNIHNTVNIQENIINAGERLQDAIDRLVARIGEGEVPGGTE